MRATLKSLLLVLPLAFAFSGCGMSKSKPPEIKFAPYSEEYASKMDFAQLEYKYPLTRTELSRITAENLAALNQEQLDQIYARLTAGPIPDAAFDGTILFGRGNSGKLRVAEIVAGPSGGLTSTLTGMAVHLKGLELETLGEGLWKGKVFFRKEGVLRNRINDLTVLKKFGLVEGEPQKINVNGTESWLLFPAKLYCGQSLFDARRESIIIDYFFTDEIKGYQEKPDFLAGRRGLRIRDEIRMVRPGLYLGRAYSDRVFLLNFVLENKDIEKQDGDVFLKTGQVVEDCWMGTQQRVAASN